MGLRDKIFGKSHISPTQNIVGVYAFVLLKSPIATEESKFIYTVAKKLIQQRETESIPFFETVADGNIPTIIATGIVPQDLELSAEDKIMWTFFQLDKWLKDDYGIEMLDSNKKNKPDNLFAVSEIDTPYGNTGNSFWMAVYFHRGRSK